MREDIPSESVDLIYLDPPFNSKRLYNAFIGGAQWVAFDDTWRWYEAVGDFHEVVSQPKYAPVLEGLRMMLGEGPQLAYLSYMANRLLECHRVLKDTGSIYLHCDPAMSHYLKAIMDGVFGNSNFRNEIVWIYKRMGSSSKQQHFSKCHDVILSYSKSRRFTFNVNAVRLPYSEASLDRQGYRKTSLGRTHPTSGVCELNDDGRFPEDWWNIPIIRPNAKERVGYPTQKPIALLERIIKASSNEGDLVLDPFCGCGTTIHAAQNLGRRWTGIDVCVNACKVVERRLRSHFDSLWSKVEFIGFPTTRDDAFTLANLDKFRFERWAASLVDGMEPNQRQRADRGIDGWGRIPIRKGQFIDLVSQVKGGHTGPGDVQAFNGARQQAGADLGIFTCFEDRVTPRMRDAAVSAGWFMEIPVVQIFTVEDYFEGRHPALPIGAGGKP